MSDFLTLIDTFQSNLPKGQRLVQRQIDAARAIYSESIGQGLDPRFALAIGYQETRLGGSGNSPIFKSAINNDKGRGHAYGYMQVLKGTAEGMGLGKEWQQAVNSYEATKEGNAELSAKIGVSYLKQLVANHGAKNIADLSASYYGGPGALSKGFTPQIRKYVDEVTQKMGLFGDGRPVSWKQSALPDNGQFMPLSPQDKNDAASYAPPPPVARQAPAYDPLARLDSPPADRAASDYIKNPFSNHDSIDSLFKPVFIAPEPMADLKPPEVDPIDKLHQMVTGIYDTLESSQNG